MNMRQKIVGTYSMGTEYCELVLRDGLGGEFYATPEHGHVPRIKVGADYERWGSLLSCLIHEAFELVAARLKCRYNHLDDCGEDVLDCTFIMDHNTFSDICGRVALFLKDAMPDLSVAWATWNKKGKKGDEKGSK